MRDKITIENLEVFAYHGVCEEERALGQKFMISLELYMDLLAAGKSDALKATIDYAEVCRIVTRHVQSRKYNLIETVAQSIADTLLLRYRDELEEVSVSIKKPWAPIALTVDSCGVAISRKWHKAYIGLGSNMGERDAYLKDGVSTFANDEYSDVLRKSDVIETKPYGDAATADFLNQVIMIKTIRTPESLLSLCRGAEERAGRKRDVRWGDRTLDLDILLYDDLILDMKDPDLTIPHVDLHNRDFVLEPLSQIAPGVIHPVYGLTAYQLFKNLSEDKK